MSAALVQDGEIVWERGFGFQNVEARIRATPDTPYPVADISETSPRSSSCNAPSSAGWG